MLPPPVARTRNAVRRALAELPPGTPVLVAMSGGADSTALGAAAAFEAARSGRRAGAVTVDHGLQSVSAAVAAGVAEQAAALGLAPVEVACVQVAGPGGPEAAARRARYQALAAAAGRHDATVLLGHTLDDQAETVLLRLARGSGARSLAGMPARSDWYLRPFLGLRRSDTAAACAALGLPVWEDPHNQDPAYARARVRAGAVPALVDALGPGAVAGLSRSAALLRDDAEALDQWAARVYQSLVDPDGLSTQALLAEPRAIRSRVIRLALLAAGVPAGGLAASHVTATAALVEDWHGQGPVRLPGGLAVVRRCGRLQFDVQRPGDRGAAAPGRALRPDHG